MESQTRRRWRCPGCSKVFSIPSDKADPDICPKCQDNEYEEVTKVVESQLRHRNSPLISMFTPTVKFVTIVFAGGALAIAVIFMFGKMTNDISNLNSQVLNAPHPKPLPRQLPEIEPEYRISPQEVQSVEKQWVEVGEWSGTGVKTTQRFTSRNGELRVTWAASASEYGGAFSVEVQGEEKFDLHLAANEVVKSGKRGDITHIHGKSGQYYLDISATQMRWMVVVEDLR